MSDPTFQMTLYIFVVPVDPNQAIVTGYPTSTPEIGRRVASTLPGHIEILAARYELATDAVAKNLSLLDHPNIQGQNIGGGFVTTEDFTVMNTISFKSAGRPII